MGLHDLNETTAENLFTVPDIERTMIRRVYVVDDDSSVRRSLSFALSTAGFDVRVFLSGRDFLDEAPMLHPGCVLLDVRMPQIGGLEVLKALGVGIQRFAVLIMTGHGDIGTAVKAMKGGAQDFLEKPFTDKLLLDTLEIAFQALPAMVDADAERSSAIARTSLLSPRERDVLQGLVAGLPNKTIADRLNVSVRTVEMHRGRMMDRLGAKSLADTVKIASLASIPGL